MTRPRFVPNARTRGGDPNLMVVAEVAQAFRVSEAHVRNLVNRGEIPCLRVGGRIRIARVWVERKLAEAVGEAS